MCKGISLVINEEKCYWSKNSNSHEKIKKENKLGDNDRFRDRICSVELYPKGEKFLSFEEKDWELIFETVPDFLVENRPEIVDRIYQTLFRKILPYYKKYGIKKLDISSLNYYKIPDFEDIMVEYLHCRNNQLTSLVVPASIKYLDCDNAVKIIREELK